MKLDFPKKVSMTELLARDGFQHERHFVPTDTKVFFIDACSEAGYKTVEVTNFSHPRYLPQARDAEEVLKKIKRNPGVEYKCYGMTDKAVERAVAAKEAGYGPDILAFTISTTDAHCMRNANRPVEKFFEQIPNWAKMCNSVGIKLDMAIACVFGCPITGPVPLEKTFELIEKGLEMGCSCASPCDTTGEAAPDRVYEFFTRLREKFPNDDVHRAHFHDSRGMGLTNYFAALMAGVTVFEASLGQLGGQPSYIVDGVPGIGTGWLYTPSDITGNGSTEDLVVMFDEIGVDTGVDVDRVLELGRILEHVLERDLRPYTTKTGRIPKGRVDWGTSIPPYIAQPWTHPNR